MASIDADKKKALGRGLASLIPDAAGSEKEGAPVLTAKKEYFLCDIEKIVPNPDQPRKIFQREELEELTDSIRAVGILQPISVRQRNGMYEIIAGERRWRAAQRAGMRQVPVLVKDVPEDMRSLQMALIENIQRSELNPMEEAIAYQQLIDQYQLSQEEVATKVGKNRVTITNMLRLLRLPGVIREDLTAGRLSMGHAKALLALDDADDQLQVRDAILKKKLSVRDTERKVQEVARDRAKAGAGDSAPATRSVHLSAVEEDLRRKFNTPVKIVGNEERGSVQFFYKTRADLMRLVDALKAEEATGFEVVGLATSKPVLEEVPLMLDGDDVAMYSAATGMQTPTETISEQPPKTEEAERALETP